MIADGLTADLIALARAVAESPADLAIGAEGNISAPIGPGMLAVTGSGARFTDLVDDDLVAIRMAPLLAATDEQVGDEDWRAVTLASRVDSSARRPTVEVALHAVLADRLGPVWILHAHPVDVLAVACSDDLPEFARTRLFPDHVVALGPADMWLPYIDPGRPLAVAVRDGVDAHEREHGTPPVCILLGNHGVFVVGSTAREALDRLLMVAKAARVFVRGGRRGMPASEIARIHGREDEDYRRSVMRGAVVSDSRLP